MSLPDRADILALLDRFEHCNADDLESEFVDFKPWQGAKESLRTACEYASCFANARGGVVVFGVADRLRGRSRAITGAAGYDVDSFRRAIFDNTRPSIEAEIEEIAVPEGTGRLLVVRMRSSFGSI